MNGFKVGDVVMRVEPLLTTFTIKVAKIKNVTSKNIIIAIDEYHGHHINSLQNWVMFDKDLYDRKRKELDIINEKIGKLGKEARGLLDGGKNEL